MRFTDLGRARSVRPVHSPSAGSLQLSGALSLGWLAIRFPVRYSPEGSLPLYGSLTIEVLAYFTWSTRIPLARWPDAAQIGIPSLASLIRHTLRRSAGSLPKYGTTRCAHDDSLDVGGSLVRLGSL